MAVFVALSVGAIFIDLFMHRNDKPVSLKRAALWSPFRVVVAMAFAGFLCIHHGADIATLFVTGYALEKVLSVVARRETGTGKNYYRHTGLSADNGNTSVNLRFFPCCGERGKNSVFIIRDVAAAALLSALFELKIYPEHDFLLVIC